ncbi:hypothetical protein ACKZDW_02360 (plasmid) [Ralstonia syzygii subsp. celebesensis]
MKPIQIGNATLYCCDCYDLLQTVPRSYTLLTDPRTASTSPR